ncbi:MAG: tetratricopeptide repeat protein [Pseudomonadales bacterium]|nr:tetratricopeptide repeat protein [Pseudomonadales bacterium]MCH1600817.1 tetratricopeptide repeat protein [Pseudomonadales bacterium]
MALQAAEEETIEALKKWWQENGKGLVIAAVAVFAGMTGWLVWENSTASQAETASDLYEEILSLSLVEEGAEIADADSARIITLAEQLRADHPASVYAKFASLFSAQQQVSAEDLAAAEADLQWILDNPGLGLMAAIDEGLILTASLRLGRVILAQGDAERALELVNNLDPQSFEGGFGELRGDIYVALGRIVDARDAYVAAQQSGSSSDGLRMKLDNLPDES